MVYMCIPNYSSAAVMAQNLRLCQWNWLKAHTYRPIFGESAL